MSDAFTMPDGFAMEADPWGILVTKNGESGYVTVNLEARCYSLGYCDPRFSKYRSKAKYSGRGWQQKLINDAAAALAAALKD